MWIKQRSHDALHASCVQCTCVSKVNRYVSLVVLSFLPVQEEEDGFPTKFLFWALLLFSHLQHALYAFRRPPLACLRTCEGTSSAYMYAAYALCTQLVPYVRKHSNRRAILKQACYGKRN